jgi:hypothetical protein
MSRPGLTRRSLLGMTACAAVSLARAGEGEGTDGRPRVADPRATDGDDAFEPNWDERLTVTVGTGADGREAVQTGRDEKVIQAALGHVARLGGGTVRLLPGTFTLRAAVVLPPRVRLVGSGADTVLTKVPSRTVALADDSDWYDREVTLEKAEGFRVGDGIVLRATNPHDGGPIVLKRTLVGRSGNRFRLDAGLRENLWLSGRPTCSALFPLLTAERAADVVVEDLTLDGDRANNENFNGNHGGGVFLQDCNRVTLRGLTSRNYNGDGISFQVCHDVTVEGCHCHDNADLGVHPGSGSQRPLIRGNRLERNTIGLFWCWGVRYGLAEGNTIDASRDYGVSVGHHDTDNAVVGNTITRSGKVGILFRDEPRGKDFWPNRNRVEGNRVVDSGGDDGVAIDVRGKVRDLRIVANVLRETRGPMRRTGLRIAAEAGALTLADNRVEGFATGVDDRRPRG